MIRLTLFEDGHAILKAAIKGSQENPQFLVEKFQTNFKVQSNNLWKKCFALTSFITEEINLSHNKVHVRNLENATDYPCFYISGNVIR